MAFDWRDYLGLARRLSAQPGDEAALRSAISRAYYSIYCIARNRLRNKGWAVPSQSSHRAVWDQYRLDKNQRARSIGTSGSRLHRLRCKADYDDNVPGILAMTGAALTQAAQ